jgi:D-lactate dehydrogenase
MAKIVLFGVHQYERERFEAANADHGHELTFLEPRLTAATAKLAHGHDAVCSFVNDKVDAQTLEQLSMLGIKLIALRCAGYNHVDLEAAARFNIPVVRVPEYSPYAVAEHAVALILALNRKIHRAYARVREWNFSLDGLEGFDLHGKTVGVVGTGRIGRAFARIALGFGCIVLAYDAAPDAELRASGVRYVEFDELLKASRIVSLHVPLTPGTHHMLGSEQLAKMMPDALLINTGRGALIDSKALIGALKTGRLGGAGLDVYEEEGGVFFEDLSNKVLEDDTLARLLSFPNVIVTSHQGFLTRDALDSIAKVTLHNVRVHELGLPLENVVVAAQVLRAASGK